MCSAVEERFELLKENFNDFSFLTDLEKASKMNSVDLTNHYKDLELKRTDVGESDVSAVELASEIHLLPRFMKPVCPEETLNFLYTNDLVSSFPNLFIAPKILKTLPVIWRKIVFQTKNHKKLLKNKYAAKSPVEFNNYEH